MMFFLSLVLAVSASAIPAVSSAASEVEALVVGGEDAELGELPYQLSLQESGKHKCGAVLLEPGLALTAAHCIKQQGSYKPSFKLIGGIINITSDGGQIRDVKEVVMHTGFNYSSGENDISLLTLTHDFDITSTVGTIKIPPPNFVTSGNLLLSGWGDLFERKDSAIILQKVVLPFISDDSCREYFSHYDKYGLRKVLDSNLCAGFPEGGKGPCHGDSGGPLVSLDTKYLVGIASWTRGCARPKHPSVYTEVAYHTNWINEQKKLHL